MPWVYDYPHPAVTTDVVLFTLREERLELLLIERAHPPFQGCWALPGGFVEMDEDLDDCAMRELAEETGITDVYLEQLYTFGAPGRDPRERVISVTYYALAPADRLQPRAASDACAVGWFPYGNLPPLAFDHARIVAMAYQRLVAKLDYSTIALQFLPERFTLGRLQTVYETILGTRLDKRNFRKRVLAIDCVEPTGETERQCNHRPARLYQVKRPGHVQIIK